MGCARCLHSGCARQRGTETVDRFFAEHQTHALSEPERVRALELDGNAAPRPVDVHPAADGFSTISLESKRFKSLPMPRACSSLRVNFLVTKPHLWSQNFSPHLAGSPLQRARSGRWSPLQEERRDDGTASSRWLRTTPSARCFHRSPMRQSCFAIASAASPMRFSRPAAAGFPSDARMWPAPSPATHKASRSPFSTFGDQEHHRSSETLQGFRRPGLRGFCRRGDGKMCRKPTSPKLCG